MAAITTSAGVLDVSSLVSQLVSAERTPVENRLNLRESAARTSLSALGIFKSAMSSFQSAVSALKGANSSLGKLSAASSTPTLFTASTATGAVAGSFGVEVLQLARAGKIATGTYASADAVVGSGTVTLTAGTLTFDVTLTDGDNTLAALRDKINNAATNTGIGAAILNENGGSRLVLTSRETGVAKAVTLSSASVADGTAFITTSSVQAALDAEVKIDGFAYTSASNTIDKAISGVTINLLKAETGTVGTLSLSQDASSSTAAVEAMVKSYNALVATVSTYSKYDASTRIAGPLMGDASVRTAMQQIRGVLGSAVEGGDITLMAQLGITTQADGSLKLDSSKLSAALSSNANGVKALFGGSSGYATRLSTVLDGVLGAEGSLAAGTKGIQARLDDISDRRDTLDLRTREAASAAL